MFQLQQLQTLRRGILRCSVTSGEGEMAQKQLFQCFPSFAPRTGPEREKMIILHFQQSLPVVYISLQESFVQSYTPKKNRMHCNGGPYKEKKESVMLHLFLLHSPCQLSFQPKLVQSPYFQHFHSISMYPRYSDKVYRVGKFRMRCNQIRT